MTDITHLIEKNYGVPHSDIFERHLANKVTQFAILSGNDTTRNFLDGINICADNLVVFIGCETSLFNSSLGQCYNLSYSEMAMVEAMFDRIHIVAATPARVSDVNQKPGRNISFVLKRMYQKTTRDSSPISFTGDIVEKILSLISKYNAPDGLYNDYQSAPSIEAVKNSSGYSKVVEHVLKQVNKIFARDAALAKESVLSGINDEAVICLHFNGVPMSLWNAVETHTTNLLNAPHITHWETTHNLQTNLVKDYVSNYISDVFRLAKNPSELILDLINVGENAVKNSKNIDQMNVARVITPAGNILPLKAVILVSTQSHLFLKKNFPFLDGKMVSVKPTFVKPQEVLTQMDGVRKFYQMYTEEDVEKTAEGVENLVKEVIHKSGIPTSSGKGVLDLTALGLEVLKGTKIHDMPIESRRQRYLLSLTRVIEDIKFIPTNDGVCAVYPVPEHVSLDGEDYYGRLPSLMHKKTVLFHTHVGDLRFTEDMYSWIKNVLTIKQTVANAHEAYSLQSVTAHTPDVDPQKLHFGKREMLTVFLDPFLYDTTALKKSLQENFTNVERNKDSLVGLSKIYQQKMKAVIKREKLITNYYSNLTTEGEVVSDRGKNGLYLLKSIELHPYARLSISGGQIVRKLTFTPRFLQGEIPMFVQSHSAIMVRGLYFLSRCFSPDQLMEAEAGFNRHAFTNNGEIEIVLPNPENTSPPPGDQPFVFGPLIKLFTDGMKMFSTDEKQYPQLNWLYDVEENKNALELRFVKYLFLPLLTKGRYCIGGKDTDDVGKVFVKDQYPTGMFDFDDTLAGFDGKMLSGNLYWVINKSNLPNIAKLACMFMLYMKINPLSLKCQIQSECHPGLAVTFLRACEVHSEEMLYTIPNSMEMVLSPAGVIRRELEDKSVDYTIKTDLWTTRNTIGPASISVPCVFPNKNAAPGYTSTTVITRDPYKFSAAGSLPNFVKNSEQIQNEHKEIILEQIEISTKPRGSCFSSKNAEINEIVPIIRPVRTPSGSLFNVLGRNKFDNIPLASQKQPGWVSFYSKIEESENPYFSELNSFYQTRFIPHNFSIRLDLTEKRFINSLSLSTTNFPHTDGKQSMCFTTETIQEMCNLNEIEEILHPNEKNSITASLLKKAANSIEKEVSSTWQCQKMKRETDLPTNLGYSVPENFYTDKPFISDLKPSKICLNQYFFTSPFSTQQQPQQVMQQKFSLIV